jgi:hypothetical protein
MKPVSEVLKNKCIELRVVERLSIRDIKKSLDLSVGTISKILKNYPLTKKEIRSRSRKGASKSNALRKKEISDPSVYYKMVSNKNYSTMQKGKIAETAVLFRLVLNNFNVFGSFFDGDKEDWIVGLCGFSKLVKIQVKSTRRLKACSPLIYLSGSHGERRYKESDFDFIIGYDLYLDRAFVFSWDETKKYKSAITITKESEENWGKIRKVISN